MDLETALEWISPRAPLKRRLFPPTRRPAERPLRVTDGARDPGREWLAFRLDLRDWLAVQGDPSDHRAREEDPKKAGKAPLLIDTEHAPVAIVEMTLTLGERGKTRPVFLRTARGE